jgi:hypothetical protein
VDHNSLLNTHNLTTDIDHDQLTNFVENEHIDWTNASSNLNTSGTISCSGNTFNLSGTSPQINLFDTGAGDFLIRNNGVQNVIDADWNDEVLGSYLRLAVRGNAGIEIDTDGKVGIGKISPSYDLDVASTGNFDTSCYINGILLEDSSDRSGLLEINRKGTTVWSGIQTKYSSTALWSLMGDQDDFGLYDDYNSEWAWRYNENAGMELMCNGTTRLTTTTDGITVTGSIKPTVTFKSSDGSSGINTSFSFYDKDSHYHQVIIKDGLITQWDID